MRHRREEGLDAVQRQSVWPGLGVYLQAVIGGGGRRGGVLDVLSAHRDTQLHSPHSLGKLQGADGLARIAVQWGNLKEGAGHVTLVQSRLVVN